MFSGVCVTGTGKDIYMDDKLVTIVVNGTDQQWPKDKEISYTDVVLLAFPDSKNHPEITFSVKFTRGHGDKPEGILAPGQSLKVKEGMNFRVTETGQS